MNFTKKIFIFICLLFIINSFSLILKANAQTGAQEPAGGSYGLTDTAKEAQLTTDGKVQSPQMLVSKIIGFILALLGVIMLNNMIFAGWAWMNAGGNEEKIKGAKDKMMNSIIGFVIILASYIIVNSITGLLGQIL